MRTKPLFDGFAQLYYEMEREIASRLDALSDRDLRQVRDRCDSFTDWNCAYGIYKVAHIVKSNAHVFLCARRAERRKERQAMRRARTS